MAPKREHHAGEPRRLRAGTLFQKRVWEQWINTAGARPEVTIRDLSNRRGRIDILIDEGEDEDWVAIIEIKRSDWDRMRPHRVRPNVLRHARQVWRYIDKFVERDGRSACPGIIYEQVPQTPGRVAEIEAMLNDRGIQVVWHLESIDECRTRLAKQESDAQQCADARRRSALSKIARNVP